MPNRFVSLWFRHLLADWMVRLRPELKNIPFVFSASERGRMVVKAVNHVAQAKGIHVGMVVADCRAIYPELEILDDIPGQEKKLLTAIAEWCIRYTPAAGIDLPDSILLDASGCTHLWGGEQAYLKEIHSRLSNLGYHLRISMADTIAAAWAVAHYGVNGTIVPPNKQNEALKHLPGEALRLDSTTISRLEKLGLSTISSFMSMPRSALRQRFGQDILKRIDMALGTKIDSFKPVRPIDPYKERLPCIEPIRTAASIETAIRILLKQLCMRLEKERKGIRMAIFKAYRVDGNEQQLKVTTSKATRNEEHLFKLFQIRIPSLKPNLGFELFTLHAMRIEEISMEQNAMWTEQKYDVAGVAELLDKLGGRLGMDVIHRYLPAEHYWPERSIKEAADVEEEPITQWRTDVPRPLHLLSKPERIEVSAPIPDHPPMLFRYKNQVHAVQKADGPERIEQEWWIEQNIFRDYYCVEDEAGRRYWLFRSGHYHEGEPEWFIHGFFA